MSESTLDASFFNADGSLKPFSQRQAERKAADSKVQELRKQIADRLAKPESRGEQLKRVTAERIADVQDRLRSGASPPEKAQLSSQLRALKAGHEKAKDAIDEQQRVDKLANDQGVKRARESASALKRSWRDIYPGASEDDVALACAAAESNDWSDPSDLCRTFNEISERISAQSFAHQDKIAADANHKAIEAEATAARAAVNAKQAELRLAQVRNQDAS